MKTDQSFRETFSALLKRKGFSISKVSAATGISKSVLHGWTTGQGSVSVKHLRLVSDYLRCPVHEILWGTPDPFEISSEEILTEIFSGRVHLTLHRVEKKAK